VGIAAPGHPIPDWMWVRAKDFAALPFVMREPESGTRAVIELAPGKLGLRAAEMMSVGSTEAIKWVLATGVGVAIVSRLAILSEEEAGTLAVVRLSDLEIRRPLRRVRPHGQTGGPALQAFDEELAETLPPGFRYAAGRRGSGHRPGGHRSPCGSAARPASGATIR
jgi:DNA-binding transcriptional LysR family regulator